MGKGKTYESIEIYCWLCQEMGNYITGEGRRGGKVDLNKEPEEVPKGWKRHCEIFHNGRNIIPRPPIWIDRNDR